MKVFIDENLPPKLAEGLNILEHPNNSGIEVLSIKSVFGQGASDEFWIPKIGEENGVVITQDFNIHRKKTQLELYRNHKIGIFILNPPSKTGYSYWQMVKILIDQWEFIKRVTMEEEKPFAYIHKPNSKFKPLL